MPRKTKKEKIIAEYHRRLQLLHKTQGVNMEHTPPLQPIPVTSPREPVVEKEEDSMITAFFKKDFKKSMFLIAIVITLEISLYFVRIIK